MALFLSPGVFPREIDLSTLPTADGALRPAFIGTAQKGPVNEPTLVTNGQQFIDTFGEPFPDSALGYAVLAYLTEGRSAWVLRVGVEFKEGMDEDLVPDSIDTAGSREEGWGRVSLFRGIDFGRILFREVTSSRPVGIHGASVDSIEFNDIDSGGDDATLVFSSTAYTGTVDTTYTLTITSDPVSGEVLDGASYVITDDDDNEIDSGTLSALTDPTLSDTIDLTTELGLAFAVDVTAGDLGEGDVFTFRATPDTTSFSVTVEGVTRTYTIADGDYESAEEVVMALETAIASTDDDITPVVALNSSGVEVPAIRTDVAGEWIQFAGSEALAAELGIANWTLDVPRSFLLASEAERYNIGSDSNRVVLDVIGSEDTTRFDFSIAVNANYTASALASILDANSTEGPTKFFDAFEVTLPGGTKHFMLTTTTGNKFDQLKMQATFTFQRTLEFADEVGIEFPYTRAFRAFSDLLGRNVLPESGSITQETPESCEDDPLSSECAVDAAYFSNIVGWFIAKSPGTWTGDLSLSVEVFDEGLGDTAGRFKVTVFDENGIALDVVDDVTFNPSDTRYIGNVVNEGSPIGGVNGNSFYQWELRPDFLVDDSDSRVPSPIFRESFEGGANGIPSDPLFSTELDNAVIGNPAKPSGLFSLDNAETFDFNLLMIPGFSSGPVVSQGLQFAENRGDVLYIVDPPFGLKPQQVVDWHNGLLFSDLTTSLNTSYGTLYHSWLKINDQFNGGSIFVPPSGHVGAVFARTERDTEQWFAPAGLNRGRILDALDVEVNPTEGERDLMYGNNNAVNPIVNFIQDGITVFGQRTLQRRDSALDRNNVRMLLIFLKKNLTRLLRNFLFEPNDPVLRSQVVSAIEPFLADIASRRGLTAFNVICDETNNTPERIDRNELWVSVFIQPTRAAEFIVLNLVILRTGASFGAQEVLAAGGVVN